MLIFAMSVMSQILLGGSTGVHGSAPGELCDFSSSRTVVVPSGGRFECTTITVPHGATIKFQRNAMNDPVMLLATGAVDIRGVIDVSGESAPTNRGGRGGPGGFDGGSPSLSTEIAGGSGRGPGGGHWLVGSNISAPCSGAHATKLSGSTAATYGSPLAMPLVGGSGGCGSSDTRGGGGGGGAVMIASATELVIGSSGVVLAAGGGSTTISSGRGSGGTIRLVAPKVTLAGSVSVGTNGGTGYLRIDSIDKSAIEGTLTPSSGVGFSVGSNMVVELDPMPRVSIVSVAGIPTNGQPLFYTLPVGSSPMQTVEFFLEHFSPCNEVNIRVVPASGAAQSLPPLQNQPVDALNSIDIPIPANVEVAVEVYGKQVPCTN